MSRKNLYEQLNSLGVEFVETEAEVDAYQLIKDIIESKDLRLWETFPVVLLRLKTDRALKAETVYVYLKKNNVECSNVFLDLYFLSLAVYGFFKLDVSVIKEKYFERHPNIKVKEDKYQRLVRDSEDLVVGDQVLSRERIKKIFELYFQQKNQQAKNNVSRVEELSVEYGLSQIFSPKQKEIIFKKLNSETLTKTELEYYSRVVKKKIQALANADIHKIAQRLINK